MSYADFLASKSRRLGERGRDCAPSEVHPMLHDWQAQIVAWAVRKGRAALWEDTGLGKTVQQVEWARLSGRRALIVAPLAVCYQTVREAAKLGVEARYVREDDGAPGLMVTNYEMVDRFDPATLDAVVLDEASILKQSAGKTRTALIDGYVIAEQLRVTKPGRIACVHVQQLSTTKASDGVIGMTDFRGEVIRAFVGGGWIFHGEVTVDKDPQAQAIRTKAHALMFQTLRRDSSMTRPAMADYVLLFRKPGENAVPIQGDVDNDQWIEWARPIWRGIRESNTLNARAGRDQADERHIAPLQLDLIERCVRLWSNPDELVLSPFAGIGSEGVVAIEQGRRYVGCELKPSYWRSAVGNLQEAELRMDSQLPMEAA